MILRRTAGRIVIVELFLVGCWIAIISMGAIEWSRRAGRLWPSHLLLLYALTPPLTVCSIFAVIVAVVARRGLLAGVSTVVAVFQLMAVWPVLRSVTTPGWAGTATHLSVGVANLRYSDPADGKLDAVAAMHSDVLILVELTPTFIEGLRHRGVLDRYPHQFLNPKPGSDGSGILSTLPLSAIKLIQPGGPEQLQAIVSVQGIDVTLLAVHPSAPLTETTRRTWTNELSAAGRLADDTHAPLIIAGDFNATHFHRAFARLLDEGLTDTHEARGQGLSRSWPTSGRFAIAGPLLRLDHALFNNRLAALSVHDVTLPGSDHRGFVATFAIRPAS